MSWTNVMDDFDYDKRNFNVDEVSLLHPLWMTEGHYVYHLLRGESGKLCCSTDVNGEPICSPRNLSQLCGMKLVCDSSRLHRVKYSDIPGNLFPVMLSEAILQHELQSIEYLVSHWPHPLLDIQNLLSVEDYLQPGYLTQILDGHGNMSLFDGFMMGFLNLQPESKLQVVNFAGFKNDRKLCRELARLSILWIKPYRRKAAYIHKVVSRSIEITQEKVQRYLNRISCIYSNIDPFIKRSNSIKPIKIILDCKVTLDDVPIGLALQYETPFRFECKRIWMEHIAEINLPMRNISKVLQTRFITHLEVEDENMCTNLSKFDSLLEGLLLLPTLKALSLPNTIHVTIHPNAAYELNQALATLTKLQKLNLSSCNLRDNMNRLLDLPQPLVYLNLRDCRLSEADLMYLLYWEPLSNLRELNLSRNNLKTGSSICTAMLERMPYITCFSISYCCLDGLTLQQISYKCIDCANLKTLGMQTFTPLPFSDVRNILQCCTLMESLQKCVIIPEAYAFPGGCDDVRIQNREAFMSSCYFYLRQLGHPDIEIE